MQGCTISKHFKAHTYTQQFRPVATLGTRRKQSSIWTQQKQDVIAVVYSHTHKLRFKLQNRMIQMLVLAEGWKNIDTGAACWCQSGNIYVVRDDGVGRSGGLSLNSIYIQMHSSLKPLINFQICLDPDILSKWAS